MMLGAIHFLMLLARVESSLFPNFAWMIGTPVTLGNYIKLGSDSRDVVWAGCRGLFADMTSFSRPGSPRQMKIAYNNHVIGRGRIGLYSPWSPTSCTRPLMTGRAVNRSLFRTLDSGGFCTGVTRGFLSAGADVLRRSNCPSEILSPGIRRTTPLA
jgi:hypothetical protein